MEPCVVCQQSLDTSAPPATVTIDGIAFCDQHKPKPGRDPQQEDLAERMRRFRESRDAFSHEVVGKAPGTTSYERMGLDQTVDAAEAVNHPSHYGGDTVYECIKVLIAWGLDRDFCLGNAVKYISRAGKKDPAKELEDLLKAQFYLNYKIDLLKNAKR